jgi:hypothetical protein
MARDVPFDEEVAERDQETQESLADVRPLADVEEMRARWAADFDRRRTAPVRFGVRPNWLRW